MCSRSFFSVHNSGFTLDRCSSGNVKNVSMFCRSAVYNENDISVFDRRSKFL